MERQEGPKETPSNDDRTVQLNDPYEPDYLTDIPSLTKPGEKNQDRKNPWDEPQHKIDKRAMAKLQGQILENDYMEAHLSLANPIDYTPPHPRTIAKPPAFKRSNAGRPKLRLPEPIASNLAPKLEPQVAYPGRMPLLQPPLSNNLPYAHSSTSLTTSQPILARPSMYQPRFAGAPNFTRFSNGTPQAQVVSDFSQQYGGGMNPGQPPIGSTYSSNLNTSNSSNAPHPATNLALPSRAARPPYLGQFPPQAQQVRPAVLDFIRHLSNTTGADYSTLLQQVSNNPNVGSIELSVPSNADIAFMQNQIDQARDLFLGTYNQLNELNKQPAHQQNQIRYVPPTMLGPSPYDTTLFPSLPTTSAPNKPPPKDPRPKPPTADEIIRQDEAAEAENDEEYHEVETYADYVPAKLNLGQPHPDPVVETSSLSTVEPPDVTYNLKLPSKIIDGGLLSALQLESVIYACQQHAQFMPDKRTRRGFLIGDGAGVGKGRTIAGIIYENFLCNRKKSIWLSVSTDLRLDAERDLKDIGAKIPVFLLNKFPYGRRISEDQGVIFSTYSGLVSKSQSVRGNYGSRLGQLVAWAGSSFDGVIVFDECHKAKNITLATSKTAKKLSKTAEHVLEIQTKLPNARIVYASATGASETRHLGYMMRLGLWGNGTPYPDFPIFCQTIEKRGVGAMEMVAVELKMRGSYIARQLSFKTTSFEIVRALLEKDFVELYDKCAEMWALAFQHFRKAESYFSKKELRSMWPTFWAAHQKFFKYMCISAKVPIVIEIAQRSLAEGKCVVIGLQSTGEAKTLEALEESDITEFVSTAKATFESLIENHFPAPSQGRRRRPNSSSTEIDSHPSSIAPQPSDKSSSASGSTVIDERWVQNDSCKFLIKDGVALPDIDGTEQMLEEKQLRSKREKALRDLAREKRTRRNQSARTLRHKRRLSMRQTDKSRIKKLSDDSETTSDSNKLSDFDPLISSSESLEDSDSDYSAETVSELEGSDDELIVVGTKSGRRDSFIVDDSDDDIQITAVKKPASKPSARTIVIESDEETQDQFKSNKHELAPMLKYGSQLEAMKEEMFAKLDALAPKLPNNTLDDLIDRLGGPEKVAEMTGRKGRVVKDSCGQIGYHQRNEIDVAEQMNIEEKRRFMNGEKLVAIISEAASSGISLQADRRVKNTRRRVHITIELPWSADRAIQQFGRTHRSNQLSGPEYIFIISELAGETRFASIVAKRLESLGALTHGDRRATTESRDLSHFNMESRYCRMALESMTLFIETNNNTVRIPPVYDGDFVRDARRACADVGLGNMDNHYYMNDAVSLNVNVFLNRILGMKVAIQNAVFDLFTKYTERMISRKKVSGDYDAGILELNSASGRVRAEEPENYLIRTNSDIVRCSLRQIKHERGMSWEEAQDKLTEAKDSDSRNGFYIATNTLTGSQIIILAIREDIDRFRFYKPNVGKQPKLELFSIFTERFKKVPEHNAEKLWQFIYGETDTKCIHMCHFKNCKRLEAKMKCNFGMRQRPYCILSGGILTIWPYLETKYPEATRKLQIIRLKMDDNNRVIGPNIHEDHLERVRKLLAEAQTVGISYDTKKKN